MNDDDGDDGGSKIEHCQQIHYAMNAETKVCCVGMAEYCVDILRYGIGPHTLQSHTTPSLKAHAPAEAAAIFNFIFRHLADGVAAFFLLTFRIQWHKLSSIYISFVECE